MAGTDSDTLSSPSALVAPKGGDLPLLVCGPMLRCVKPADGKVGVSVFFVASEAVSVKLRVQGVADEGAEPDDAKWQESGEAGTVPLGPAAHACVVTGEFDLKPGALYAYDLAFGDRTLKSKGVVVPGELAQELNINGGLPRFLAPPDDPARLRVAYGSCRKANGQSQDALALMAALLADPQRRPHQLLLIGDQLYADEVAPSYLDLLRERARLLFNAEDPDFMETLPGHTPASKRVAPTPAHCFAELDLDTDRGDVLKRLPGWGDKRSPRKDQHLIFLHEFFAAYMTMFSPALWWDFDRQAPYEPGKLLRGEYRLFAPRLRQFHATLGDARRVLANVPTFMILDDHEVTDDWNLDSQFIADLRACNLEARIVRNALAAYAVFQDWGNRPELYEEGQPGRKILDALKLQGSAPPKWLDDETPEAQALDELLLPAGVTGALTGSAEGTLPAWSADGPEHAGRGLGGGALAWSYVVEFGSHRLIVLDTRTRRHFPPDGGKVWLAQLISKASLQEQIPDPVEGKLDLVVSATPIYGEPTVEAEFKVLRARLSARASDQESWSVSEQAMFNVSSRLMKNPRTIVLSGDVHYAFSLAASLTDRDANTGRVVQLCSSSLRREDTVARAAISGNAWVRMVKWSRVWPDKPDEDPEAREDTPDNAQEQPGDDVPRINVETSSASAGMSGRDRNLDPGGALPMQLWGSRPWSVIPHDNFALVELSGAKLTVTHSVFWVVPKWKFQAPEIPFTPINALIRDEKSSTPQGGLPDLGADYGLMCHVIEVEPT